MIVRRISDWIIEYFSEYEILRKDYINLVRCHDFFFNQDKRQFCFTMDLMDQNLEKFIENQKETIPFSIVYKLLQDVVLGYYTYILYKK